VKPQCYSLPFVFARIPAVSSLVYPSFRPSSFPPCVGSNVSLLFVCCTLTRRMRMVPLSDHPRRLGLCGVCGSVGLGMAKKPRSIRWTVGTVRKIPTPVAAGRPTGRGRSKEYSSCTARRVIVLLHVSEPKSSLSGQAFRHLLPFMSIEPSHSATSSTLVYAVVSLSVSGFAESINQR